MKNTRLLTKFSFSSLVLAYLAVAVFSPSEVMAAAGGVQICTAGSTCTVGEFLYNDASAPINNATCTITSWYPDNTSFFTAGTAMDVPTQSDGWYSKTFTAPATSGLYRTSVTCTVSGDNLSIDKSFQVNAVSSTDPSAVATAVWGYSGKTLDSFGTLPYDIWNYSTRTVSSFGSLIGDIWASATRTLTGATLSTGSLATKSDIDNVSSGTTNNTTNITNTTDGAVIGTINEIKGLTKETRLLLEKVVNKPVIQNVLENTTTPISDKLNGTRSMTNQLYVNNQFLTAQSATLTSDWNATSGKDLLDNVIALSSIIGTSADSSDANTMFGSANWIRDSWNWDESTKIYDQLVATDKIIGDLKEGLADYQKTSALYSQAKLLVKSSLALEKIVGTVSDSVPQKTLFVKIKTTQDLASKLDEKGNQVDKVLGAFVKSKDAGVAVSQIGNLQNQIIALNKVPGAGALLQKVKPEDTNSIKNVLLGLRGIISSNKMLLSLGSGKILINTWLEVGSIVFKTLATNPSNLISQDVQVKYYLPQELKKEDIIKTDAGLAVNYDTEKDQLYVEGTFKLSPGQTRTFSVETKDIWLYSPEVINSMKKQADDLFQPLQKTAFFAQAVSLKSDINANLDQMTNLQNGAVTPEGKIKAYRECAILKKSVDDKLTGMKDLVGQASSTGNLFGFVGGSQTIAVWGLIIVITAGFIFMTIYMKTITAKAKAENQAEAPEVKKQVHSAKIHSIGFVAVMLISSVLSAGTTGFVVNNIVSKNYEQKLSVLGTETSAPVPSPAPEIETKAGPTSSGQENLGIGGQYLVIVSDTPTGFLRVRSTPNGEEIAKVNMGDKLPFVDEQNGWYKVQLEDGTEGWVSKEYSAKQ